MSVRTDPERLLPTFLWTFLFLVWVCGVSRSQIDPMDPAVCERSIINSSTERDSDTDSKLYISGFSLTYLLWVLCVSG